MLSRLDPDNVGHPDANVKLLSIRTFRAPQSFSANVSAPDAARTDLTDALLALIPKKMAPAGSACGVAR